MTGKKMVHFTIFSTLFPWLRQSFETLFKNQTIYTIHQY